MNDNEDLFDSEDIIVLTKKSIKFYKNVENITNVFEKKLKDLDGNWEFINTNDKADDILPDEWISNNQYKYKQIYEDIKYKSEISSICDQLTFVKFMEYLQEMKKCSYSDSSKINWDQYEEYKLYKIKNPGFEIWTSFFIEELFYLYNDLNSSKTKLGKFHEFIEFCYINSSTNKRLPEF